MPSRMSGRVLKPSLQIVHILGGAERRGASSLVATNIHFLGLGQGGIERCLRLRLCALDRFRRWLPGHLRAYRLAQKWTRVGPFCRLAHSRLEGRNFLAAWARQYRCSIEGKGGGNDTGRDCSSTCCRRHGHLPVSGAITTRMRRNVAAHLRGASNRSIAFAAKAVCGPCALSSSPAMNRCE